MWEKHRGLVWSNPEATDTVHLRAALLNPRFDCLLEAATVFGIDRLRLEWGVLTEEDRPEARRARAIVERILKHIAQGFKLASSPSITQTPVSS
jgi:hypothetical protein